MADLANATCPCNLVAIDIGRYGNAVLIETAGGKRHRFKMANTAADFGRLLSFLCSLPGSCRVGLEPTGDYHRPIAHWLLRAGFDVVSVNSVALARYREAIFNSWDKNDPKDASVILEMLRRGDVQCYVDPMAVGTHDLQETRQDVLPSLAGTHEGPALIDQPRATAVLPRDAPLLGDDPQRVVCPFPVAVSDARHTFVRCPAPSLSTLRGRSSGARSTSAPSSRRSGKLPGPLPPYHTPPTASRWKPFVSRCGDANSSMSFGLSSNYVLKSYCRQMRTSRI